MKILTNENKVYDLDQIPDREVDLKYCVFDCSDKEYMDFFFQQLVFLESFYSPGAVLQIDKNIIHIPLDWSIMICDEYCQVLESMPIVDINDRGFKTLLYNPIAPMVPEIHEVNIIDVHSDIKWFFPKLKVGTILPIPIDETKNPPLCSLFFKDGTKIPDQIDAAVLF